MIKLAGSLLVLLGCAGLGFWYRGQFRGRIYHIQLLITILEIMISQVRYCRSSLPECCRQLAQKTLSPYRENFQKIWEETKKNSGEGYREIFVKNIEICMGQVPLCTEEKRIFSDVMEQFGYEEAKMQINSMEQCKEQLKSLCAKLEKEVDAKGKAAMGLGVLSGFFVIIILL